MLKSFRTVGLLEGLSFLLLLGIAMPMKYALGIRDATYLPGMIHGVLFMLYVALATWIAVDLKWTKKRLFLAYVASVLPLGTLVFDRKYLSER